MVLREIKYSKAFLLLWLVMLIGWMGFVFSNSLENAEESGETSQGVVEAIEEIIQKVEPDFEISDHFVRKLAHFIEFFILGSIFVSSYFLFVRDFKYHVCLTLLFGLVASLFDETLQLYSVGRASMVKDVWLDFSAVVVSVLVFVLINCIFKHKKSL